MISGKTLRLLLVINAVALITIIILLTRNTTPAPAPQAPVTTAKPVAEDRLPPGPDPVAESEETHVAQADDQQKGQDAMIAAGAPVSPYDDPMVPMVFIQPLPEDKDVLDPAHLQIIRSDFVTALRQGPPLDPKSPEYLARWNALKEIVNQEFRVQFGTDAFLKYQEMARQAGLANARQQ